MAASASVSTSASESGFTGKVAPKAPTGNGIFDQDRTGSIVLASGQKIGFLADGHGQHGRECAELIIGDFVGRLSTETSVVPENLTELFLKVNDSVRDNICKSFAVKDDKGVPCISKYGAPISGGAVVTVVVLGQDEVTVANVGDAEAFLYSRKEDGTIDRIKCTTDHGPENQVEQLRLKSFPVKFMFVTTKGDYLPILDADGNPIDYAFKEGEKWYNSLAAVYAAKTPEEKEECTKLWQEANKVFRAHPHNKKYDTLVWSTKSRESPGAYLIGEDDSCKYACLTNLQNTRAIGDFAQQQVGVIPTPDTMTIRFDQLPPAVNRCVFVASDGVHDCFTKEELAELVLSDMSDDELVAIFVERSKQLFGGKQHDDISFLRCAVPPAH
jgi:serine/threonine protein phosphatase PrpC